MGLGSYWKQTLDVANHARASVSNAVSSATQSASNAYDSASKAYTSAVDTLAKTEAVIQLAHTVDDVSKAAGQVGGALQHGAEAVVKVVEKGVDEVKHGKGLAAISTAGTEALAEVKKAGAEAGKAIADSETAREAVKLTKEAVHAVGDAAKATADTVVNSKTAKAVTEVAKDVSKTAGQVLEAGGHAAQAVSKGAGQVVTGNITGVSTVIEGLKKAGGEAAKAVGENLDKIEADAGKAVKAVTNDAREAGTAIANSEVGKTAVVVVKDLRDEAVSAAKEVVGAAKTAADAIAKTETAQALVKVGEGVGKTAAEIGIAAKEGVKIVEKGVEQVKEGKGLEGVGTVIAGAEMVGKATVKVVGDNAGQIAKDSVKVAGAVLRDEGNAAIATAKYTKSMINATVEVGSGGAKGDLAMAERQATRTDVEIAAGQKNEAGDAALADVARAQVEKRQAQLGGGGTEAEKNELKALKQSADKLSPPKEKEHETAKAMGPSAPKQEKPALTETERNDLRAEVAKETKAVAGVIAREKLNSVGKDLNTAGKTGDVAVVVLEKTQAAAEKGGELVASAAAAPAGPVASAAAAAAWRSTAGAVRKTSDDWTEKLSGVKHDHTKDDAGTKLLTGRVNEITPEDAKEFVGRAVVEAGIGALADKGGKVVGGLLGGAGKVEKAAKGVVKVEQGLGKAGVGAVKKVAAHTEQDAGEFIVKHVKAEAGKIVGAGKEHLAQAAEKIGGGRALDGLMVAKDAHGVIAGLAKGDPEALAKAGAKVTKAAINHYVKPAAKGLADSAIDGAPKMAEVAGKAVTAAIDGFKPVVSEIVKKVGESGVGTKAAEMAKNVGDNAANVAVILGISRDMRVVHVTPDKGLGEGKPVESKVLGAVAAGHDNNTGTTDHERKQTEPTKMAATDQKPDTALAAQSVGSSKGPSAVQTV